MEKKDVLEEMAKEDNRVHVPEHIKEGLIKYAYAERKRMDNPVIRDMITWRSLANHILLNEIQKRGYYVAKKALK